MPTPDIPATHIPPDRLEALAVEAEEGYALNRVVLRVREIDDNLIEQLTHLGHEYGPLGVAVAAATLTDPDLLCRVILAPEEVPVEEIREALANIPPVPSATARFGDQDTSTRAGRKHDSRDIGRFSRKSRQAKLLSIIGEKSATAQEAARRLHGDHHVSISQIEGTRRRVSDLRRAGLIRDSGGRRANPGSQDEAVVWRITDRGYTALRLLRDTGWSK